MGYLKLYFIIFCSAILCKGKAEKCWTSRDQQIAKSKNTMEVGCLSEPRETIVKLDVPEGFDMVIPPAVIAKRCSELTCTRMDQECVATGTSKRMIRAEVINMNMGMQKKCVDIEVEDHVACTCRCDKTQEDCGKNKLFNKKRCSCDCLHERMKNCQKRMLEMPNTVMWDSNSCSCPCNNWVECGSGEVWVGEKCRCVDVSPNDI